MRLRYLRLPPRFPVRHLRLGWALCLSVLLHPAFAAPQQYHVDSWTTENGLPQNVIRNVCQTPDGYLWLATMDGLARFDGVRFSVFNRSNTPGILGNRYTSLYCTDDGELWAGTEFDGVTRYHRGRFISYTTRDGLPSNFVWGVTGYKSGHIWAVSQHSIVEWNGARCRFAVLHSPQTKHNYFPIGSSDFCSFDGDRLHLFVRGQSSEYPLPRDWPRWTGARAGEDLNGAIWLAAADGRLARWSGDGWRELRGNAKSDVSPGQNSFAYTYRDSHSNVWSFGVASAPGDLMAQYLDLSSAGRVRKIVFNSFYEDREGSVWLATDGQGLYRIRKPVIVTLSTEEGLPDRNVYPIYQDRSGAIWIGTWNGGLARFFEGKFTSFTVAANGRKFNRITSLSEDRDGALWMGSYSGLYQERNGRFTPVEHELLYRHGNVVQAIHQDREGTEWFGTAEGLLSYQDRSWKVITAREGLATDDVRVMIDGRAGNLWIGGYGGLTSFDHGVFRRWKETDGLPSNSIRSLYEDDDGVLWIGTYDGGLGRLQNGRFTRYTTRDGLFNNGVFRILEDARGYLWMSCNRGIYRVSKKELNEFATGERHRILSISYGTWDSMRNEECNGGAWPAGIRARNGELWFPTQDGVAVIDADHIPVNRNPLPVVIESIALDHQYKSPDQPIRIPPGAEDLQINYTALSFIDPAKIRFKYRLAGLDRDWVDAYTRRTAYYSHLPPGNYEFRVIAANSDGVWNLSGAGLHIAVLPPFYRTWWFLTLALLSGVAVIYFSWRNRISKLERANRKQEAFSRQLMASQESERKRIAAELHDSLGQHLLIINNWAALALRGWGGANYSKQPLTEISTAALQAIDEVRGIAYNLRPYQLEKLGLTTAIQDLVNQVAASSTIRFMAEVDRVDGAFPNDVEIGIYRIVQEGLNNIVRHSQATEARLTLTYKAGLMKLSIHDNGRGFTPAHGRSRSAARGGFGLLGIAERARMSGGHATIQSAPGAGTTISISLKSRDAAG